VGPQNLLPAALLFVSAASLLALQYPSPVELAVAANRLYVVCEGTNEVLAIDTRLNIVVGRVRVGRKPKGIALSPDGARAWVPNSWSDTVSEIDTKSLTVLRTLPTGMEPNAAIADATGRTLYVANRISNDISVIDLASGRDTRRLQAGRGASYLAAGASRIYATHIYPSPHAFRDPPASELTVIDTAAHRVIERQSLPGTAGVFHAALSSDGRLGIAAALRPKNLVPLAHVARGWVTGNVLAVFGDDAGESFQAPLDELDRYFTPPFGVAIAPDKSLAFVSTTGSDSVTVVDLTRLLTYARSLSPEQRRAMANDLSASANYVVARIPVGLAPKGIALDWPQHRLYVANRSADTISVIDVAAAKVVRTIRLPGPAQLTPQRRGERLFYTARFGFQGHFGCANCHLEGTFDGLSWDLEPDGFGRDIVDNRLLESVEKTAPFKWNGGNATLDEECGPRTEKFFYRSQSYSAPELADLVAFVKSIPARPNRYRAATGLTPQQERGKVIFDRSKTRTGTPIPDANRCVFCHSGPLGTNQGLADVGTGKASDRSPVFDVPQLTNIALTAPYLHDGSARTLEEIWTVFNPKDTHGYTNDLTKDELNDLIEYLRTL
jgi:YVTN family beta-propeller protein